MHSSPKASGDPNQRPMYYNRKSVPRFTAQSAQRSLDYSPYQSPPVMKLKRLPEDFQVEELTTASRRTRGDTHFID